MELDAATLPDTLTVDVEGKATPLRDTSFVREAPDLATLVKAGYDAHREVGARIPIKTDGKPESIAEWRKTHLPNIYKAGLLDAPPATPADYGLVKPDNMPAGLEWNDERASKYAGVLHKFGIPKAAVPELMALHVEALTGVGALVKTSVEAGTAALKSEFGTDYDVRVEEAKRLTAAIFKSPEELALFESTGIGNHPGFLGVIMRLAPLVAQDSSVLVGKGDANSMGDKSGESVTTEVASIMNDATNPRYKLYHSGDKSTLDYIDNLYKKAYGTGTVEVGSGAIR
jgi:hypothetical protein